MSTDAWLVGLATGCYGLGMSSLGIGDLATGDRALEDYILSANHRANGAGPNIGFPRVTVDDYASWAHEPGSLASPAHGLG